MSENLTQGELYIQSLQKRLPVALFRELVWRLLWGRQSSAFATNWLLRELERERAELKEGGMKEQVDLKEWRYETLYPRVCALRARLQGWLTWPQLELAPEWLRDAIEALKTEKLST